MKYILEGEETERLRFRILEKDDFETWQYLFEKEKVATFLGLDTAKNAKELCQIWFDKAFHRYENELGGMNVLINKKTNEFIGQCGLLVQTIEGVERLEIGYSILPQFLGKGYASEAAQKCKEYAFTHNFTESLVSVVHIDNIGSEKVALKNGMTLEKHIESYDDIPVNVFSISREEYIHQLNKK